MFEISANNCLCDVILGSGEKTSDLAAHFSRNPGAANTFLFTIQKRSTNIQGWQNKVNRFYEVTCDET